MCHDSPTCDGELGKGYLTHTGTREILARFLFTALTRRSLLLSGTGGIFVLQMGGFLSPCQDKKPYGRGYATLHTTTAVFDGSDR
jgi:hypothetical protein